MGIELTVEGNLFVDGRIVSATLGIDEGRIVSVKKVLRGDEHLSLGNKLVLPGMVDLHVHARDPPGNRGMDLETETGAACAGGVTCIGAMPNTDPPLVGAQDLLTFAERVGRRAWCDVAPFAALVPDADPASAAPLAAAFKLYMTDTTGGLGVPPDQAGGLLSAALGTGRTVTVHAEHPGRIGKPGLDPWGHHQARPPEAEAAGIAALKDAVPGTDRGRVWVAHLTSRAALDAWEGSGFGGEVSTHHLFLSARRARGGWGKVNPPLRTTEDQQALWRRFMAGGLVLATDHAPHHPDDKGREFDLAPSGMPAVEFALPLMMVLVRRGDLSLSRLVESYSTAPASRLGLPKGRLAPGYDADLAILDLRQEVPIDEAMVRSGCGWTPYTGHHCVPVAHTFVRGRVAWDDGELGERCGTVVGTDATEGG